MAWDQKRRPSSEYIDPHKAARILAAHHGVCHLCGHPGATEVDHIVPWAEWTNPALSVHDQSNLAPAHGSACPTCGRDCHADKSKTEAARGRARSEAARAAKRRRPPEQHPGMLTPPLARDPLGLPQSAMLLRAPETASETGSRVLPVPAPNLRVKLPRRRLL